MLVALVKDMPSDLLKDRGYIAVSTGGSASARLVALTAR
jgi:hypothetical protein